MWFVGQAGSEASPLPGAGNTELSVPLQSVPLTFPAVCLARNRWARAHSCEFAKAVLGHSTTDIDLEWGLAVPPYLQLGSDCNRAIARYGLSGGKQDA